MSKEQPQFNMSAVFTSHRGPDEQFIGRNATITSPVPASLTPEIDAVVDDVMKWVKSADAENEEDEDDNLSLNVSEHVVVNGTVERSLQDSFVTMGDPPSLLPGVNQFGRTLSTPVFNGSSGSMIDLGLGHPISRPTPSRGLTSTSTEPGDDNGLTFHFGASSASLTKQSTQPSFLGTNSGSGGNGGNGDTMDNLGLFSSPSLVGSQIEPKSSYPSLGQGFSLTPPPSSSSNEPSPFAPTATMPFHYMPLGSSLSQSNSPGSVTPPSSSSPPQLQLFNSQQQPQPQPQPSQQPKLIPPPAHVQPPQSHSPPSSNQTHFVGTAAVFVPKSMMASSSSPQVPDAASSAPGSFPLHKDFNSSYNHPGMFTNEVHNDVVSFSPQPVGNGNGGYNVESSSSPQPSNGANYRTKGCWYYFQTGHCQKGERCNFSHDRIPGMEIAPPVPSGSVPGMYLQPMPPPPYGYGVPPEVPMVGSPRTMAKSNPYVVPSSGSPPQGASPSSQQVVQPPPQPTSPPNFVAVQQLYRTKPCRFFFEKGTCLKGDRCNFSHDPQYAAAYAAANPNSGFQMPDMSRFTNTGSNDGGSTNVNNGGNNIPNTGSNNGSANSNGTNGNGVRGSGSRHQPPSNSSGSSSSLLQSSSAASRLSSASEVDFPPLC